MSLRTNHLAASKYARELAADAAFLATHDGYYKRGRGEVAIAEKVAAIKAAWERFRCDLDTAKAAVEESWSIVYEARKAQRGADGESDEES